MSKNNGIKRNSNFRVQIGEIFRDEKRDIIINHREYKPRHRKDGSYKCNDKWYRYTCNKCGWTEGWIEESHLLHGTGCSCCRGFTAVLGINTIYDTNKWMIPIVGEDIAKTHTCNSNDKVIVTCPDCGRVKDKLMAVSTIYRQGISCNCSDNIKYPNKFAFKILEEFKVDFLLEYSPEWCKYFYKRKLRQGKYDFYIPSMNLIIEMDGGWHTQDNTISGKSAKDSQFIDNEKDRLAKEHGIEVIRIDCNYDSVENRFEYIEQSIMNNIRINELFNISTINWNKCNEFALSNLVKTACEFKMDNPIMSSYDISSIMGVSQSTVICWLKQGDEIWCHYDPKEEMRKSAENNRPKSKQVEVFKDNVSLGIYPSGTYLEEHGEELFNVKLSISKISVVCHGKRKHHQGLVFKFVD